MADKFVKMSIASPFTNEDLSKLCENKVTILRYQDLAEFKPGAGAIDRLLGPHKAIIILYETDENWGHWVAFFKMQSTSEGGIYEFFDSYGLPPDSELKFMDDYHRDISGGKKPHLSYLIETDNTIKKIYWNQIDLQSKKKDTNTCGRWAGLRILLREKSLSDFQDFFIKQTFSPDWYATIFTMFAK